MEGDHAEGEDNNGNGHLVGMRKIEISEK
jgi:hypothetical protein